MTQEVEIIEITNYNFLKNEFRILLLEYFSWMFKSYNDNFPNEWQEFLKKSRATNQLKNGQSPLENYVGFLLTDDQIKKYLPPNGYSFIAKKENKTIGMGSLCKLDSRIGEIKRIYVNPNYQGKKIGKKLFERTLSKAKEIGFEKLRLETIQFMDTATHMYESYGFKEIDQYEGSEAPEGLSKLNIYMELNI